MTVEEFEKKHKEIQDEMRVLRELLIQKDKELTQLRISQKLK